MNIGRSQYSSVGGASVYFKTKGAQSFGETGATHFALAAESVPARIRKRFLMRLDAKTGGNFVENQN